MNVNGIKNVLLGTALATSLTACKQTFKEAKNVEPFVQELVDSISVYSKSPLADSGYKCYAKDTLALGKDFQLKPEKFLKTMQDSAESKVPTRLVDSKLVLINTPFGRMVKNHEIKEPIYKDTKAIITSPKIFEKGGEQYVPVEFWGK